MKALENLISEDPSYSDAYDVMGRAQFELGKFDQALATYKIADASRLSEAVNDLRTRFATRAIGRRSGNRGARPAV